MNIQITNHPVYQRAVWLAGYLESTAQTIRGITKFLRDQARDRRKFNNKTRPVSKHDYLKLEGIRKSKPDTKRAIDDEKFRKAYLKKLRTRELKLINVPTNTLKEITAAEDSRYERKRQLLEIHNIRKEITGKVKPEIALQPTPGILVKGYLSGIARMHGCDYISLRGNDYRLLTTKGSGRLEYETGKTEWNKGRPVKYTRAKNDNYVRSFALITSPRTIQYAFHKTEVELTLPEGYEWKTDTYGLFACRGQDHYHPDVTQLLMKDASAHIVYHIGLNAERREIYRLQEKAEAADMEGVFVCLADARRAGNCEAGCRSFIERNHLSSCKHYKATELLEIAGGDRNAVRLAITAASIRTKRENEIGMAVLTDHFPDLKYA